MNIPETPEGRPAHHRLMITLDAAMRQLVIQIGGPKIGPGLAKVFESPEALGGPYGFQLGRMADDILARCPEIEELLVRDDWEDTILPLLQQLASDEIKRQISPGELEELHSDVEAMADKMEDLLGEMTGDGRSPLGDALDVDQQTVAREPWRLREAFPVGTLGLHGLEITRLEDSLGVSFPRISDHDGADQYAQTIWPYLLQLSSDPLGIDLPESSKPSRLCEFLELDNPAGDGPVTSDQCIETVAQLFRSMGRQGQRQKLVRRLLGRMLRAEYGLSRGRKVTTVSSLSNQDELDSSVFELALLADPQAEEDFALAEDRVVLEGLWALASPAQREALEVFAQAEVSGKSVAEVSRGLGRDPNVVRNNLQAFRRKVRSRLVDS